MIPAKITYDFETDIFTVVPIKREYSSSFDKDDIVIDLDNQGKVVGLELMNASENFGIPKSFLKNIIEAKVEIEIASEVKIKIFLKSIVRNSEKTSILNYERAKPEFINPSRLEAEI